MRTAWWSGRKSASTNCWPALKPNSSRTTRVWQNSRRSSSTATYPAPQRAGNFDQQDNIDMHNLAFLQLLQLADSALPVGAAAHSFGLETLVAEEWLSVETLETFLHDYLSEAGTLECSFCLRGHSLTTQLTEN